MSVATSSKYVKSHGFTGHRLSQVASSLSCEVPVVAPSGVPAQYVFNVDNSPDPCDLIIDGDERDEF